MNHQLIKPPLTGDIVAQQDVRLVGRTHPLAAGRLDIHVRAGQSIAEILDGALTECGPGSRLAPGLRVHIDGCPVERGWWHLVRPKPGTTVTFTPVPGNLRTALSLAVVVAALFLAPYAAGFLAPALWAGVGISYGTTLALVSAGIILGGTLALNALFPTRPAQLGDAAGATTLPSIAGAQNQAAPFQPIPVCLGVHRLSPFYAAKPYTEIVGDDQYLRLLFCWGYGPLSISDIKIGETPLSNFSDYEIETREGYETDDPVTLFPGEVHEDALAVELDTVQDQGNDIDDANIIWNTRTSAVSTDQFSVDVTAPQGVYQINQENGQITSLAPVKVKVQYRAVGDVSWIDAGVLTFLGSVKTARKGLLTTPGTRDQWEVRVGRSTRFNAGGPTEVNDLIWTAFRSFKNDQPINFPLPLALTALRIKATDQLNGTIDTLNGLVAAKAKTWNGAAWVDDAATQSPADLIRLALQGPANARPVPDAQIDLANLAAFADYCTLKGFKFNQVRTSVSSVYDCVADIAAAGRAVPTFIDGKWGAIWDRPDDTIVQHFTPRNSWGFGGSRVYAQLPHAWRVKFINEQNGYTADERIVYDDGYTADNATLFEGIEFPGVTDPDLIWKHGRFHIAQSRLRPEEVSLSTGWENLVCTRGDRVRVTHDVLLIGQIAGRIKSIAGQNITIDEAITIEADKTYGFRFRNASDAHRSIIRAVDPVMAPGEYAAGTAITLVGDLTVIDCSTSTGFALFGFGETDQESAVYRVKAIAQQKDLIAQLTLVDDAPEISTADTGTVPDYNPNVTLPVDPFDAPPQHLQYLELIDLFGAQARTVVRLSWTYPRLIARVASFEVQIKDVTGNGDWVGEDSVPAPRTSTEIAISHIGQWGFRVRCLFLDGTVSSWATLDSIELDSILNAPGDVVNLRASHVDLTATIEWDEVEDFRPLRYEIRKGAAWETALKVGDVAHPPFATVGDDTYWVGTYVGPIAGETRYSPSPLNILISGSVLTVNVIAVHDQRADEWPGTFTGGAGIDLPDIRTGGSGDITEEDDVTIIPDVLDLGEGQQSGTYTIPESHRILFDRVADCRVMIDYAGLGTPAGSDITLEDDITLDPDITGSGSSRFVDVYPEIRVSQDKGMTWGDWQRFSPGIYRGNGYDARMQLFTFDPSVIAYCTSFTFSVDVPDRADHITNHSLSAGGESFTYRPDGAVSDAPFNGGPNGALTPNISIDIRNAVAGDLIVRSAETLSGFTLQITNGGVGVARTVDIRITGY